MRTKLNPAFALALSLVLLLTSCANQTQDVNTNVSDAIDLNQTQTLFVGISNNDESGSVNPFYITDQNSDIVDAMNSRLVTLTPRGEIEAGEDTATISQEYSIRFVNEKDEVHSEYEEEDRALYTFVIKPNARFSDGSKITADDVLFTLYTMLDPLYSGGFDLSSLPIEGLWEYKNQMTPEIQEEYLSLCEEFLENGEDFEYDEKDENSDEEDKTDKNTLSTAFWQEIVPLAGEQYCHYAVKYVTDNYLTDEYVRRYLSSELSAKDVEASQTLKVAYAMVVWEVGKFNDEGKFVLSEREIDVKNGETLSLGDFWDEIYSKKDRDLEKIDDDAAGENTVSDIATKLFVEKYGPLALSEKIESIKGISKGQVLIEGEVAQTVSIILSDYSPSYLSKMSIPVLSKTAYTDGYEYSPEKTQSFGVELNSPQFMAHIKNNTFPKISSGAYKPAVGPLGQFYEDGVWYFVRNDYFDSLGTHDAYIKNLAFVKTVEGEEYSQFEGGFLNAVDFTPDLTTAQTIIQNENVGMLKVGANAYGYILINPRYYADLNERIALASIFDPLLAVNYYPKNTAMTLIRSNTKNSFAYPAVAEEFYSFTNDDETVKELFEKAGYEFEEKDGKTTMKNSAGEQAKFVFTLPSKEDNHPAGTVFKNAVTRLIKLGALAEIAVDENLTQTIHSDAGVAIYAMGRKLTTDPDSRHIYDYQNVNDTTVANGIAWLWENGDADSLGEIEINGKDRNQSQALEEISELLNDAAYLTTYSDRGELYADALNILSKLCIEVPMYQRNSLFVYDKNVLDVSEIEEISVFSTPTKQLYKLRFLN